MIRARQENPVKIGARRWQLLTGRGKAICVTCQFRKTGARSILRSVQVEVVALKCDLTPGTHAGKQQMRAIYWIPSGLLLLGMLMSKIPGPSLLGSPILPANLDSAGIALLCAAG